MNPYLTVSVVVENQGQKPLKAEHGLSLWLETGETCLLFDTGQSNALIKNAKCLGLNLEKADYLLLSHGHYDHTGGVADFLKINQKAQACFHPDCLRPRYSRHPNRGIREIGILDSARKALEILPSWRRQETSKLLYLSKTMGLTGQIPRTHKEEEHADYFFFDQDCKISDPIPDDQSFWLITPKGLIVITGCCHAGLINTLSHIRNLTGISKIWALMGGFHLSSASSNRLDWTLKKIIKYNPEHIFPCHCTGETAQALMKKHFPQRVHPCRGGDTFIFSDSSSGFSPEIAINPDFTKD